MMLLLGPPSGVEEAQGQMFLQAGLRLGRDKPGAQEALTLRLLVRLSSPWSWSHFEVSSLKLLHGTITGLSQR